MCLLVDPAGAEARKSLPVGVEHAHRRKPRAGQLTRGLEHAIEHRLDMQLAEQTAADLDQALQPFGFEGVRRVDRHGVHVPQPHAALTPGLTKSHRFGRGPRRASHGMDLGGHLRRTLRTRPASRRRGSAG
jgi:hypothetical protein